MTFKMSSGFKCIICGHFSVSLAELPVPLVSMDILLLDNLAHVRYSFGYWNQWGVHDELLLEGVTLE